MLSLLFWNVHQRPLGDVVAAAAADNNSDVVILAECDDPRPVLGRLNTNTSRFFAFRSSIDGRFVVFSRLPEEGLTELGAYEGLTFFRLSPPIGKEVLLVAAHLPSKLWLSEDDQAFHSRRFGKKIVEFEERVGHQRTVLLGDLNMNPFELGMVSADGFHATSARMIAHRGSRTIGGERYPYFYNPMWNHLGDDHGPPGTYYRGSPTPTQDHWHLLDQVLVRPALLNALPKERVRIITSAGGKDLLRNDGRIDKTIGSDHLPLSFDLDLLQE